MRARITFADVTLGNKLMIEFVRNDQHAGPFVVQAVWLVCGLAALLICVRLLRRQPGRPA